MTVATYPGRWLPITLGLAVAGTILLTDAPAERAGIELPTDLPPIRFSPVWPQYRGNARRTAFALWGKQIPPQGAITWRLDLGPMLDASPVVASDGTIYLVGPKTSWLPTDQLAAITPSGTVAWKTILVVAEEAKVYRLRSTPAIRRDGSLVVVGLYMEPRFNGGSRVKSWYREERVFLFS